MTHRLGFRTWGVGAVLIVALFAIGGCAKGPRVVESWKDPGVTGPLRFKKILVLAFHPDAIARRSAEDELVRQIGADRAIPASAVLSDADRGDLEKIKAKVKQSGVDGVVTMRIAGTGKYVPPRRPGPDSYSYDAFWKDDGLPEPGRPEGAAYSDRTILLRTRIYSVADQRLVWEGVTESSDVKDAQSLLDGMVKVVSKRLREEHLID
jgi:hypothetical protein